MKFSKLYEDVKASDLFKPASPEEVIKRKTEYSTMKLKDALDNVEKTKLPDGSWHVHETIWIGHIDLFTLKNVNISITDKSFYCDANDLTNLEGAPKIVHGNFDCSDNLLTSLGGAPKVVDGVFNCHGNKNQFTEEDVRAVCDVKKEIWTDFN